LLLLSAKFLEVKIGVGLVAVVVVVVAPGAVGVLAVM
jgi:hypothetical protein